MSGKNSEQGISTLAFAVIAIAFTVIPLGAQQIYTGEPISLELADADLEEFLVLVSQVTGKVIVVEPQAVADGGLDRQITAQYESTPWDRVIDEILATADLSWTLEDQVLWVHEQGYALDGDRAFKGGPISLRLRDADIHLVMKKFSKISGFDIEVDPSVEATVTVSLKNMPWDQVFDLILRVNGLAFTHEGNRLSAYPVAAATGKQLLPPPDQAEATASPAS